MHELKIPVKVRLGRQGVFTHIKDTRMGECIAIERTQNATTYTFAVISQEDGMPVATPYSVLERFVIGEIEGQATLDLGPKLRPEPDFRWIDK